MYPTLATFATGAYFAGMEIIDAEFSVLKPKRSINALIFGPDVRMTPEEHKAWFAWWIKAPLREKFTWRFAWERALIAGAIAAGPLISALTTHH